MKIFFSFLYFLCIFACPVLAQTNDYSKPRCLEYYKYECPTSENVYYKVNEASRSALYVQGQTSKVALDITNGRDYRISFCIDSIFATGVRFQLVDRYENTVLYDNAKDNMAQEFEFTVTETRSIFIVITVPFNVPKSKSGEDGKFGIVRKDNKMGCVGLLVEYMITPFKGF